MSDIDATHRRIRSLVTGANTGIGYVTARELARRGDHVVVACRSEAKAHTAMATIMAETGNTALEPLVMDLADLASVQRAASELLASGEPLDVVVANAGIGGQRGLTPQGFELHFGTNHLGHFLFVTQLLPLIEAAEAGRVVVVSSMAHLDPPGIDFVAVRSSTKTFTGYPEYGVSKLANVVFAQELARRTPERVFVGSVHPGVVATDMWKLIDKGFLDEGLTSRDNEAFEGFSADILLGRASRPDDLVGVSIFLASAGSDYMTGQSLMVDGGMVLV